MRESRLDVIRLIAIGMIVTFHFVGIMGRFDTFFYGYANGGWGSVGCTIFFLLSGFVLTMASEYHNTSVKQFYRKRFLAIFPALWIAWILSYIIYLVKFQDPLFGGAPWKLIFTVIGFDGYLPYFGMSSYALVGEWFTGMIILIYLVFPLWNRMMKKQPELILLVMTVIYFVHVILYPTNCMLPIDVTPITGLWVETVGIYLAMKREKIKTMPWLVLPLVVGVVVIITIKLPWFTMPWKNFLGIFLFMILYLFPECFRDDRTGESLIPLWIQNMFNAIEVRIYALYLVHHFVLYRMQEVLAPYIFGWKRVAIYYIAYLFISFAFADLVYRLTRYVTKRRAK